MSDSGDQTFAGYQRGGRYGKVQEFERVDRLHGEASKNVTSEVAGVTGVKPTDEAAVSSQPVASDLLTEFLLDEEMQEFALQSKRARFGKVQEFERLERLHDEQALATTSAPAEILNEFAPLQATVDVMAQVAGSQIWQNLEQGILTFNGEQKAGRYAEVVEFEKVDRPHDAPEANVAKLIDAANAFDVSDASELDGNISVVPELAYTYY
ncbi:hypothetical protein [Arsukibacterium sp.]|uniref:hypothetical protein n=1 Tax=Arsukibacterium sp. TaxID=1977258 RepID=UPI00299ED22B|nr:hypothetical protein [Arsukibacterium sp.]MDX1677439.1 hypothetical protein [Arsukibacterium sp.]